MKTLAKARGRTQQLQYGVDKVSVPPPAAHGSSPLALSGRFRCRESKTTKASETTTSHSCSSQLASSLFFSVLKEEKQHA